MTDSTDTIEDEIQDIKIRQRVRLFNLSEDGSRWCERGIGFANALFFEDQNATYLLVNSETDGSLILKSKIEQETAYMKQQGRFIIWTEKDNIYGLSFQVNAGCDDIWEILCQVQGKDPYSYVEIAPDNIKKEIKEEMVEEDLVEEDIVEENIVKEEFIEQEIVKEEVVGEEFGEERVNILKEEDIKQEPGNLEAPTEDVAREMWFEEMLDIEHVELSTYEQDVLEQLIELVNRLVSPAPEDKIPAPSESRLLDLFHISEDIEETEGLQQLHETMLYLLSMNKDRQ